MSKDLREHPAPDKPVLIFTLIHGTFAKGDRWTTNDSNQKCFRSQLRERLGMNYEIQFEVFDWGNGFWSKWLGDNREDRRQLAIDRLCTRLEERDDVKQGVQHYLVGHSHGGNIALRACRSPEACRSVTGVITLATPFLKYSRNDLGALLLGLSTIASLIFAASMGQLWIWVIVILSAAINLTVIVANNFGDDTKSAERVNEKLEQLAIPKKDSFVHDGNMLKMYPIRAHLDEVTSLFLTSHRIGNVLRWLGRFVNSGVVKGFIVFYVATIVAIPLFEYIPILDRTSFDTARTWADRYALGPGLLAISGILFLIAFFRLWFALDGLPWIASVDVQPDVIPWPDVKVHHTDSFSVYRHAHVKKKSPEVIARLINEADKERRGSAKEPTNAEASTLATQ